MGGQFCLMRRAAAPQRLIQPRRWYVVGRMYYQEFAPAAALRPLVDCYWQFRVPPAEVPQPIPHTVLPDGGVSLVWFRAQSGAPPLVVWGGPRTQNYQQPVWPGSVFSGVRF